MFLRKLHPLIVFLLGCLAGVGAITLKQLNDERGRVAEQQRAEAADWEESKRVQAERAKAFKREIADQNQDEVERERLAKIRASVPEEFIPSEAWEDNAEETTRHWDRVAFDQWNQLFTPHGFVLKMTSVKMRHYLLNKANEQVCLKCSEINPATVAKGYPVESCHRCAGH